MVAFPKFPDFNFNGSNPIVEEVQNVRGKLAASGYLDMSVQDVASTVGATLGIDLNNFSIWAFAGNDGTSFESWFKPNIDALSESNIDLLLYGFIEQDGYDLSVNISSQLTNKIIAGVMMDYENYNRKNEISSEDSSCDWFC